MIWNFLKEMCDLCFECKIKNQHHAFGNPLSLKDSERPKIRLGKIFLGKKESRHSLLGIELAPSQQQSNGHSELLKDFIGANIRSV
jgi:hypothetical protein